MNSRAKGGVAVLVGAAAIAAGGFAIGEQQGDTEIVVTPFASTLAPDQYQGVCAVVTPPNPDPCDAVNGTLRYGFFGAVVNSTYHPKWSQQNPGEVFRLAQKMAAPVCSVPASPQTQVMQTFYGAALGAVAEAIACARHPEAITMPSPNPKSTGTGDRQAPSPPGPITVAPGP